MSAAYYVCTTKVDFPATVAPGVPGVLATEVPGVLRLYYKSRKKRQNTFSTATTRKPAEGLRLYVKKRKNTTFQKTRRGVAFVCQKRKNTTVLAPRQRRNPQRVVARTKRCAKNDGYSAATRRLPAEGCPRTEPNVKKRRFWHRDHAETRRGLQET